MNTGVFFRFSITLSTVFAMLSLTVSAFAKAQGELDAFIYGGIVWSVDGQSIAIGTSQGVWLHDSKTLSPIRLLPSSVVVTALAINHQGDQLAVGFADGSIEVWNLNTFQSITAEVGHSLNIRDLQWNAEIVGWQVRVMTTPSVYGTLKQNLDHNVFCCRAVA